MLVQGFAAARALGLGPLHRHQGSATVAQGWMDHGHHHAGAERHHHDRGDVAAIATVDRLESGLDDASFALTAALALMVLGLTPIGRMTAHRPVWRARGAWALRTHTPALPLKPPRLA